MVGPPPRLEVAHDLASPTQLAEAPLAPAKGRGKIPLEKGYSQIDWLRRARERPGAWMCLRGVGRGLAGWGRPGLGRRRVSPPLWRPPVPPPRTVTPSELAAHASPDDAWTALRGKVYALTPYVRFHPGGAAVLRGAAGADCTKAFDATHAWVNADALLASCLIGRLVPEGEGGGGERGQRAAAGLNC